MPTRAQVHASIDLLTQTTLAGYSVHYDNTDYESFSQQQNPFVSLKKRRTIPQRTTVEIKCGA